MKFNSSLFIGAVAIAATSLVAVSANADKVTLEDAKYLG